MRLVKLSTDEFPEIRDVEHFFGDSRMIVRDIEPLKIRVVPGKFYFGNQISADGLSHGEALLFTYQGKTRFIARAASGREDAEHAGGFQHYFVVDMKSLERTIEVTIDELEEKLRAEGLLHKSLKGHAWVRIPDSELLESILKTLVRRLAAKD